MILLILLTSYIFLTYANLVGRFSKQNVSISFNTYAAILFTIFQIFATVSLLGFIKGGIAKANLVAVNFLISSTLLVVYRKDFPYLLNLYQTRIKHHIGVNSGLTRYLWIFLIAFFLFECIFLSLKVYFFPNYVWDEMVYHLHPVVVWFQTEQIPLTIETPSGWVNFEILGSKRLVYWLFVFLGNDSLVNGTQLIGAMILFLASYRFLVLLGTSTFISFAGAFAVFNLPLILIQTQTNQEHVNLAAFTFTSLLLLVESHSNRKFGILLFIVSAILMVGTKTSAILHLLILIPFLIANNWKFLARVYRKRLALSIFATFAIPASLLYVFNKLNITTVIISTIGYSKSSVNLWEGMIKLILSYASVFKLNLMEIPSKIMDQGFGAYNADSDSISSFGPQFLAFGILGLIAGIYAFLFKKEKSWSKASTFVLYAIALQSAYFSFYNSPWNYRLFIIFSAISVLVGVYSFTRLQIHQNLIYFIVLIFGAFTFVSTSISEYTAPKRMRDYITKLNFNERSTLGYYKNLNQEPWIYLSEYLEKDEPIAFIALRDAWIYPYFNSSWNRKIYFITEDKFTIKDKKIKIDEKEVEALRKNKIRFLHIREENLDQVTLVIDGDRFLKVSEGIYLLQ